MYRDAVANTMSERGDASFGTIAIVAIMFLITTFAFISTGEKLPERIPNTTNRTQVLITQPQVTSSNSKHQSLQLYAFSGSTVTPQPICQAGLTGVVLIIDKSGSMKDSSGGKGTKITSAKNAAKSFIDILSQNKNNQVALVTFSDTGQIVRSLTSTLSMIKTDIDAITTDSGTCTECGIQKANEEIATHARTGVKTIIVLLTDGKANHILGTTGTVDTNLAEQKARDAVTAGYNVKGTALYSIGLGNDVNTSFLQQIATQTNGKYYFSPTGDSLAQIFQDIGFSICNN